MTGRPPRDKAAEAARAQRAVARARKRRQRLSARQRELALRAYGTTPENVERIVSTEGE